MVGDSGNYFINFRFVFYFDFVVKTKKIVAADWFPPCFRANWPSFWVVVRVFIQMIFSILQFIFKKSNFFCNLLSYHTI